MNTLNCCRLFLINHLILIIICYQILNAFICLDWFSSVSSSGQFHRNWFYQPIPLGLVPSVNSIGHFHRDWFYRSIPLGLVPSVNSIGTGFKGQFHWDWFHRSIPSGLVPSVDCICWSNHPAKESGSTGWSTGLFDCFGQSVCSINRPLSHQFHCIFSQVRFWLSFGHEFLHQQGDGGIEKEKSLLQIPKAERKIKHTVSITSY